MSSAKSAMAKGLERLRARERRIAAAGVFLLSLVLAFTGLVDPIDNQLAAYRASLLNRAPSGDVAIVEIDAKSISAIDSWPWSRSYHASLIRRLHAAGASVIAFDVDFSATSNRAGDLELARALHDIEPVILPVFEQRASTDADNKTMVRNQPSASLRASWIGGVNISPGSDGMVREFPAATMIKGQVQPSMATLLADNSDFGNSSFLPDWSIDARRIPRMSFIDVLNGHVPDREIRGKRLIVGATAIELGDRYAIPRFGTVPGVVVQAVAADSLLQHRALSRVGTVPMLILSLLIIALIGRTVRSTGFRSQAAAGSILVLTITMPVALQARWPVSLDAGVPLTASLLAIGTAFIVEFRHRGRLRGLYDPETGLPNRQALQAHLSDSDDLSAPTLTAAGIDRFETIRSVIGNRGMEELVSEASTRLHRALERPIYQIAPDALAWLSSDSEDLNALAKAARMQFDEPFRTGEQTVDVRCTLGVARLTEDRDFSALVERSVTAVHLARSSGANSHSFQSIAPEMVRNLSIMGELRGGMERGDVFVAYQPKLNLKTGKIDRAEALVRWRHRVEGFIAPDRFIPLAEETGEVRHLTRFVLRRVVEDWARISATNATLGVSVNVSTADVSEAGFAALVRNILGSSGLDPARLTIEITESAIIRSQETALNVLWDLRAQGIRLSIDDYGTGQSTLSYLKKLPVSELKIDKMFVGSMHSSESDRIMVRSTIDLAHELGIEVVAEGAEHPETVTLLQALNCDYVQGYAVAKAMAADQLVAASMEDFPISRAA